MCLYYNNFFVAVSISDINKYFNQNSRLKLNLIVIKEIAYIQTLSNIKIFVWSDYFFFFFEILGKILVFYIIFYIGLAGFFGGLLAVFYQTLNTERPKWQLAESIIGTNPGLGFRPMPPEAHLGSTLIWYKSNRPDNMIYWHDTVNKFLDGKF